MRATVGVTLLPRPWLDNKKPGEKFHGAPLIAPLGKERMVLRVRSPRGLSLATMAAFATTALFLTGCAATDPMNALQPFGEAARMEVNLFNLIFAIAAVVFVLVEALLIYAVFRYRSRPNDGIPHQTHGHNTLEIVWTIIPTAILIALAVPTVTTIADATAIPTGPDVINVKVVGHQWWWEFDYTDPNLGIVTSDELHIPTGTKVELDIESADVIHSFWVPQLGGKVQAIPNQHNHSWIEADQARTYNAQCYQLCGSSHANMRFIVVAESKADFDKWVQAEKAPAAKPTAGDAQKGEQVFMTGACIGCHTINGTNAQGKIGPNLTHIGSHQTLAGATLQNNPTDLALWLHDPPGVKPGSIMPNLGLTDDQIKSLSAYLESLK